MDVECPYCEEGQEINHDDGYGYSEDVTYEQECSNCEKNFTFTTSISLFHQASKADCLNGGEHQLKKVFHVPRHYPEWKRCKDCNYENRGDFVEVESAPKKAKEQK